MRPSAGETTASGSFGTLRGGSRKNCRMKSAASQNGTDHHPQKYPTISATATAAARKSQPSLAMMGWGYGDTDCGMGNGEWGMGNRYEDENRGHCAIPNPRSSILVLGL